MISAQFSQIRDLIYGKIFGSKKEIRIAVAWFTNQDILNLLVFLLPAQKISLLINSDYINCGPDSLDFSSFQAMGGKLYLHNPDILMHNKFCIIDDEILITGSYNYTYKAEYSNKENVLLIQENKKIIDDYITEFNKLVGILPIVPLKRPRFEIKEDNMHEKGLIDYMANDLLYKAIENKNPLILNKARLLNPKDHIFLEKISSAENTMFNKAQATKIFSEPVIPSHSTQFKEIRIAKKQIVNASLGIETRQNNIDGKFWKIIEKGIEIPFSNQGQFFTIFDNQRLISVKTYRGENQDVLYNTNLGEISINDLPPLPAGQASITVIMSIKTMGELEVTVKSDQTGNVLKAKYYCDFCNML